MIAILTEELCTLMAVETCLQHLLVKTLAAHGSITVMGITLKLAQKLSNRPVAAIAAQLKNRHRSAAVQSLLFIAATIVTVLQLKHPIEKHSKIPSVLLPALHAVRQVTTAAIETVSKKI